MKKKACLVYFEDCEYERIIYNVLDEDFNTLADGCLDGGELCAKPFPNKEEIEKALLNAVKVPGYEIVKIVDMYE